jgi:hypothetical protein
MGPTQETLIQIFTQKIIPHTLEDANRIKAAASDPEDPDFLASFAPLR